MCRRGRTYADVARELGCSVAAVHRRLVRPRTLFAIAWAATHRPRRSGRRPRGLGGDGPGPGVGRHPRSRFVLLHQGELSGHKGRGAGRRDGPRWIDPPGHRRGGPRRPRRCGVHRRRGPSGIDPRSAGAERGGRLPARIRTRGLDEPRPRRHGPRPGGGAPARGSGRAPGPRPVRPRRPRTAGRGRWHRHGRHTGSVPGGRPGLPDLVPGAGRRPPGVRPGPGPGDCPCPRQVTFGCRTEPAVGPATDRPPDRRPGPTGGRGRRAGGANRGCGL